MCKRCHLWLAAVLTPAASLLLAQEPSLRVAVSSDLDRARVNETVELPFTVLKPAFRAEDLPRIRVTEEGQARELLAQPVDDDGDGTADRIVFQASFESRAKKTFTLTLGDKRSLQKEDFRVYGRFVRERFDDFAWENDLVAHRVYGPALETWQKEPLTSSGVDVWVKRTRALIINDWYMVDDYHVDHGEGGDFYSVGPSRGCGGNGIWKGGRLFVSRNFRESRVFANGPIRLVFELRYEPWDTGGVRVSERKRVTLDAGSHFNRIESIYSVDGVDEVTWATGIKKAKGAEVRIEREKGTLRTWEALKEPNGNLGCAVVLDPGRLDSVAEADGNVLLVGRTKPGQPVVYHAGSGWDKGGDVPGAAAWDALVEDLARRLSSPLRIEVMPR
jgi:unsaturated rhamnogalacturonyl hydrolase